MSRRWIGAVVVCGALVLAGCGSDDPDDSAATTTEAPASTSTEAPEATTTSAPATTEVEPTSTVVAPDGTIDCQALLEQYAAVFQPDDLTGAIALFRSVVPNMPDDVAAATTRLADAYEAADANLANIDMADVDLSADAETFSDWTNDGCPSG